MSVCTACFYILRMRVFVSAVCAVAMFMQVVCA